MERRKAPTDGVRHSSYTRREIVLGTDTKTSLQCCPRGRHGLLGHLDGYIRLRDSPWSNLSPVGGKPGVGISRFAGSEIRGAGPTGDQLRR